eukprot:3478865-Amphidinium_carterae.4
MHVQLLNVIPNSCPTQDANRNPSKSVQHCSILCRVSPTPSRQGQVRPSPSFMGIRTHTQEETQLTPSVACRARLLLQWPRIIKRDKARRTWPSR